MSVRPESNGRGDHTGKIDVEENIVSRAKNAFTLGRVVLGVIVAALLAGAGVTVKYTKMASAAQVTAVATEQQKQATAHATLAQRVDDHIASTDKQIDWLTHAVWELVQHSGVTGVEQPPAKRR